MTEQSADKVEKFPYPWIVPAQYAKKDILSKCGCKESDVKIFDVNRVDQISAHLREYNDIKKVVIIGHSGTGIFVGSSYNPNTNIMVKPGPNNVHPSTLPWGGLLKDAEIELWGCHSATTGQDIANASGHRTMGFTNFLNFEENGKPFVRWYRPGGAVWFKPTTEK